MSLITQPQDLTSIDPRITINTFLNSMLVSSPARRSPSKEGHSNKNIPIGLSSLASSTNFLIFIPLYVT